MKKQVLHAVAALFLLLVAAPLFAVQRNVVDEVIRMARAGVAEETILEYIDKTDARIVVTGDDVIAMTEANLPKAVIKAVVDAADTRRDRRDYRDRSDSSPRVVVAAPYYGYGNGYGYGYGSGYGSGYYAPYYYDPFWYRPSLYLNFGFGGYYGRGFHGGGFRGGSRGGSRGGHHGRH